MIRLLIGYNNYDFLAVLVKFRKVSPSSFSEVLTFYIPVFSTFRFVASRDPDKITRILKFWCVLSITFPLQYLLSFLLAE
jgi:hypothetical protein